MNEANLIFKLAFNFIPNIGAVNAKNLISYCGGIEEVFKAKKSFLLKIPGIGEKRVLDIIQSDALRLAENELKVIEKKDISIKFYLDKSYPSRLKEYADSPLILYWKGKEIDPNLKTVAIIGTRRPSPYGIAQCEKLVESLKEFNVVIYSGLAYGIDSIAHRKAVEIGCPTYGILGNGMNSIYPSSNRKLAQRMLEYGGIISEFPMDTKPDRENFPKRNRIIAGMADVVIVVESDIKGGSIITAEIANEYNKDIFAVPGRLGDQMSSGCNHLIKTHKAHLLTSVKDIAYIMRWASEPKTQQLELNINLLPDETLLLDFIRSSPQISIDTLLYKSKLNLSRLSAMLLNLEFKGLIKSLPGKNYIVC